MVWIQVDVVLVLVNLTVSLIKVRVFKPKNHLQQTGIFYHRVMNWVTYKSESLAVAEDKLGNIVGSDDHPTRWIRYSATNLPRLWLVVWFPLIGFSSAKFLIHWPADFLCPSFSLSWASVALKIFPVSCWATTWQYGRLHPRANPIPERYRESTISAMVP